ncbi:hypothetical protein [Amphritea sp. HPY]|uniref:hypothetical protein n=1 Tax=Amphritea sp. HPY TaxID=3421652 RepID=UPI003D7D1A1A
MKFKGLFTFIIAATLVSPVSAHNQKDAGKKPQHQDKRSEQQLQQQQRATERADEMEQRRAACINNSEAAECAGLQKGRNKNSQE